MDLRRLSMLVDAAAAGSFAAAAQARAYVPSAVSQQIAALEREVGAILVERTPRGIRLTPAGEVLVAHARELLARVEHAKSAVADAADDEGGQLRLACFATAAPLCLRAIAALAETALRLSPSLVVLEPAAAIAAVTAGELDVAVIYDHGPTPPAAGPELVVTPILDEPMLLVVPDDHPAAALLTPVDLTSVAAEAWVLGETDRSPCTEATRRACHAAGFDPRIAVRTDDYTVATAAAAAGVAVALVPRLALDPLRPGTTPLPVSSSDTRRQVSVIRRAARTSRLLDAIVEQLATAADDEALSAIPVPASHAP